MKMKNNRRFLVPVLSTLLLLVLMSGCTSTVEQSLPSETPVNTPIKSPPTETATEIPPTDTATPVPTSTPTSSATTIPTSTASDTPTSTLEPAVLTLIQDSVCMTGASYYDKVDHYANSGKEYPVLGQSEDQSWWLVEKTEEQSCWVYAEVATVRGDIEALPVVTPLPLLLDTSTVTPSKPGIYYIVLATDTGGQFGCGDNMMQYYPGVWVKGDTEDDILAALNALFANHNQYVNGFLNPMYKSDLRAKSVDYVGGDVVVRLSGTFVRPKDKCESARMHDQVWYTVRQFTSVRPVIFLNKALLGDLLVVAK